MSDTILVKPIAHIQSVFPSKFGIPRQSGLTEDIPSYIVFEKEFRCPDALRGLSDFSHLWIIWGFSANTPKDFAPTVRPPRLGGNKRMGVFATRSPNRPNPLGLSSVKIEEIQLYTKNGPLICVSGADLMDQTPIYDLKPYIQNDCHRDAICGFADETCQYCLKVHISEELLQRVPAPLRRGLLSVLSQDPRPSYQKDPARVYGFPFGNQEIKFQVDHDILTVIDII